MAQLKSNDEMTFMDHLEALRWHIVRSLLVVVVFSIAFLFIKDYVFTNVIFAAKNPDFPTYRFFCWAGEKLHLGGICIEVIDYNLINGDLTLPFLLWFKASFMLGFIVGFPYILWEVWRFVKPALYEKERKNVGGLVFAGIFLFYFGCTFGYYVLAPFSINFLGNFSLGAEVQNVFTVTSYIGVLTGMVFWCGVIFEIPIIAFFLAKFGLLGKEFLAKNRKYAVIIALVLAAIITPSGDAFSLTLVTLPLWLLYEVSIWVVTAVERKRKKEIYD